MYILGRHNGALAIARAKQTRTILCAKHYPFPAQEGEPAAPTFDWMPAGMKPMADGEYDVIVMGTGFTEVKPSRGCPVWGWGWRCGSVRFRTPFAGTRLYRRQGPCREPLKRDTERLGR